MFVIFTSTNITSDRDFLQGLHQSPTKHPTQDLVLEIVSFPQRDRSLSNHSNVVGGKELGLQVVAVVGIEKKVRTLYKGDV